MPPARPAGGPPWRNPLRRELSRALSVKSRHQKRLQKHLVPMKQAELFLPFVAQYYGRVGADDLTETCAARKVIAAGHAKRCCL